MDIKMTQKQYTDINYTLPKVINNNKKTKYGTTYFLVLG